MSKQHISMTGVITTPLGKIGISMQDGLLTELRLMPDNTAIDCPDTCKPVADQLSKYFSNSKHSFNLATRAAGTDFQQRVWKALTNIPSSTTVTYGELAKKLKSSARAVGQACRNNPLLIIVPCHRVVSASGLGGYAGATTGELPAIKQWLLQHESQKIA